jgi:hypothetical protein
VTTPSAEWDRERSELLGRRISELGLRIQGSPIERLVHQLNDELASHGLVFRPPVYLSDQWGCPDGTPLIGVPFYLADERLARLEEEMSVEVEGEQDSMKFLRHEAGHALNYAYRLYDRPDWRQIFGPYSRPYRERFRADPFSRDYVRHILGWYAQKHPDEDFAETFAVWLTPELDWRSEYAGWGALQKLEYVDRVMAEVGGNPPEYSRELSLEDMPVEAMKHTVGEHYSDYTSDLSIGDERFFDGDLKNIFAGGDEAPDAERAGVFIRRHRREVVGRISYWTGESTIVVRPFIDFLTQRSEALDLRVRRLEAATLIELTAFGTAVMMNHRYTNALDGARGFDI